MSFDYAPFFRADLPPAAVRWNGFPEYNFVGGHNDADGVPVEALSAALSAAMQRDGARLATYGMGYGALGYGPLRDAIAALLQARAGMATEPDNILITTGSMHGIDLVNGALLASGDTVIVEGVSYGGTLSRLRTLGVNYTGVSVDGDGMRMDHLAEVLAAQKRDGVRAKFIYTIPTVQNPTGTVLTTQRRREMLDLAGQYGLPIFEDDCYADLLWDGERPATIRSMDRNGQVIYCGSFSKSIAPALRVGYVVADWPVLSRILPLKADGGCGALEQMALAEYCPTQFDSHVDELQATLRGKCDVMVAALEEQFGAAAEFSAPKGGIFIWITLPDSVDTDQLATIAAAQGVLINPGSEWSADADSGRHRLRLCFGHPSHDVIRDGVARLAEICHDEFGVPIRGANVER
ncbi:MAG: PLP-dependent aminotransferase family protein [Alphaproteobacteria bacterium]|jgi:2-aminoadipate transaminase|nr:PLP-dependent aminotransferase family protein [Alphaproteobacteria bacterium]